MIRRSLVLATISLGLLVPSFAQRRGGGGVPSIRSTRTVDLNVRVTYPNDRPAEKGLEVSLMAPQGGIVQQGFTDDIGNVSFRGISPGRYRIRVSGIGIEPVELSGFEINPMETVHYEYVHVTPKNDGTNQTAAAGAGMISAAELNIPDKARKEFERGVESMQKSDAHSALEHFEKATAIYPQYALAYNNIGVIHVKAGEMVQARQAFETAVSLNPKMPSGYLNLARISMQENKYPDADQLISKALTIEPNRAEALTLAAQAKMMMGQLDAAYDIARKVHAQGDHKGYPVVHLIAARVLQQKGDSTQALAEYKQFLVEAPDSPSAPTVRNAIAQMSGQTAAAK